MSDYKYPSGHDCPSTDSAPQPHPPEDGCEKLPETKPPKLDPPEKCPDPPCKCPKKPDSSSNCLEDLIDEQAAQITVAEKAKAFKADLEALLAKATTAAQEYTRVQYEKLVKQWVEQDHEIAGLIRAVVCRFPCWRCIIECYVCPLLNEMHYAEEWLYRTGPPSTQVYNLYELRFWYERDLAAKQRVFERIKKVLAAWEKPAQTIEKNLADDAKLIETIKTMGSDPKVVYDLFLKLIPMHLAIAPPANTKWKTEIGVEYTQFCGCDTGCPDDCCGPDVGVWSLRQRLTGPQPYLIDPNNYFKVICCLVEKRYRPSKDQVAAAEAAFQGVDNDIQRAKAQIENGLKNFERDAKGAIPNVIDCCGKELPDPDAKPSQAQ